MVDDKLRGWLEGRCRMLPGGAWLVEVPVVRAVPALAFVLPDEAAKDAYLSCAVKVGRVHLASEFLYIGCFLPIQSWLLVSRVFGFVGGLGWWVAAFFCATAVILWRHSAAGREDERLRAWLQYVGKGAPPGSEPMKGKPWARGWLGRLRNMKRCRPGWMVVAESAALCAFAASLTVSSFGFGMRYGCQRALAARWEASAPVASFPSDCFAVGSWSLLFLAGVFVAFVGVTSWGWWRWNRRPET